MRVRTELAIKHGQEREIYRTRINNFVHEASRPASIIDYTRLEGGNYNEWLKDPDDEPLLAAALVGKAGYVVSWNTHDFPPNGGFAGVRYLTPPDFYQVLYAEYPRRKLKEAFEASDYRVP